jgi:phenylpyruvate tautomerase PptA (4-oxalocrotonate tautomerase family)
MPVVIVNMYVGRDRETKRRIAEGITRVFEAEKVPRDAVSR